MNNDNHSYCMKHHSYPHIFQNAAKVNFCPTDFFSLGTQTLYCIFKFFYTICEASPILLYILSVSWRGQLKPFRPLGPSVACFADNCLLLYIHPNITNWFGLLTYFINIYHLLMPSMYCGNIFRLPSASWLAHIFLFSYARSPSGLP